VQGKRSNLVVGQSVEFWNHLDPVLCLDEDRLQGVSILCHLPHTLTIVHTTDYRQYDSTASFNCIIILQHTLSPTTHNQHRPHNRLQAIRLNCIIILQHTLVTYHTQSALPTQQAIRLNCIIKLQHTLSPTTHHQHRPHNRQYD